MHTIFSTVTPLTTKMRRSLRMKQSSRLRVHTLWCWESYRRFKFWIAWRGDRYVILIVNNIRIHAWSAVHYHLLMLAAQAAVNIDFALIHMDIQSWICLCCIIHPCAHRIAATLATVSVNATNQFQLSVVGDL